MAAVATDEEAEKVQAVIGVLLTAGLPLHVVKIFDESDLLILYKSGYDDASLIVAAQRPTLQSCGLRPAKIDLLLDGLSNASRPPRKNLREEAPKLLDVTGTTTFLAPGSKSQVYELVWPNATADGIPPGSFFYDHNGEVVAEIKSWLDRNRNIFGSKMGFSGLCPSVINGLIKTGKSFVLNAILPAVVAADHVYGIGGRSEVSLVRLDLGTLPLSQVVVALERLGCNTMSLKRAKEYSPAPGHAFDIGVVIDVFQTLPFPVLIVLVRHSKGVRRWALPRLLKQLCRDWPLLKPALDGLDPPSIVPMPALDGLVDVSENLAMLAFLISEVKWGKGGDGFGGLDALDLSSREKLLEESIQEWRPVLEVMDCSQRRAFRSLAMPGEGLILAESVSLWGSGLVGLGFVLKNLTEPICAGSKRVVFASACLRTALMMLVDLEGNMKGEDS